MNHYLPFLIGDCCGIGTMPRRMASLHLPSPLAEKSENSAWSEDVHDWYRQLSVQNWEKTMCPQGKNLKRDNINYYGFLSE